MLTLLDSRASHRLLHPSAGPLDTPLAADVLATIADGLGRSVSADHLVAGLGSGRRHERLLETDAYEAWLIAWGPSTYLDLHDHGGSAGALRVVSGQLVETATDLDTPGRLRSRRLDAGDIIAVPANRVHEVWNPQPSPAVSVHVYSPPLGQMTFYDTGLNPVP
jgi:predicted metal-dependent enzyme (double-stranded beta helix superfamily)